MYIANKMKVVLYPLVIVILSVSSCGLLKSTDQDIDFYEMITGYDIQYIPIFPPLRAASIDKGQTWSLTGSLFRLGDLEVERFAVSKNYVFGVSEMDSLDEPKSWFIYNEQMNLCAVFDKEENFGAAMFELGLTPKPTRTCNDYFALLEKNLKCEWYPEVGESYPQYLDFKSDIPVVLNVRNMSGPLRMTFKNEVKFKPSHLHHFKIVIEDNSDSLLYVSFNNQSPVFIENNMEMTVFNENRDYLDVAVYTPFPVAEKKGISENDRLMTRSVVRFDSFR